LPVLSGGAFYRLGEEGDEGKDVLFQGVVIAATWKTLAPSTFRPDLLSRIATNRLTVPSLAERMDDFPAILAGVERAARERTLEAIDALTLADQENTDRGYWDVRRKALPSITDQDRTLLAGVDWSLYGNLRGLRMAVDLMIDRGLSARDAIPILRPIEGPEAYEGLDTSEAMTRALLNRRADGKGLQAHVKAVEREFRSRFQRRLRLDRPLQSRLALRLEIEPTEFSRAVSELDRDRSTHR